MITEDDLPFESFIFSTEIDEENITIKEGDDEIIDKNSPDMY